MYQFNYRTVIAALICSIISSGAWASGRQNALAPNTVREASTRARMSELPDPGGARPAAISGHASVTAACSSPSIKADAEVEAQIQERLTDPLAPVAFIPNDKAQRQLRATDGGWKEAIFKAKASAGRKRVKGDLTEEVMFSKDIDLATGVLSAEALTISKASATEYYIKGIYGLSTNITATVDTENGTVTIAAQGIYRGSRWGDLYICPIEGQTYNPRGNLVGYFDEDGNVSFGAWGIFPVSGDYAGYAVATFRASKWLKCNSVVRTTGPRDEDTTALRGVVEQENPSTVNIYGLLGYSNVIVAGLTPSKTLKITPQALYTAKAGEVKCYPIEEVMDGGEKKLMINYSGNVKGAASSNGFTLSPWTAAVPGYGSAYVLESTSVEIPFQLQWPAPISSEWKGTGTAADPYIISTAADLAMLSQKVEEGNDYEGYHFALGGDIDMSTLDRPYYAIGSAAAPFNGTLDGRNHKISNLDYNSLGLPAAGLFGAVGASGQVKDLTLADFRLTGTGDNIGTMAGIFDGKASGVKGDGCSVSTTGEATGGLAGQLNGSMENCTFAGTVTGKGLVGGLVGFNAGSVERCSASASVSLNGTHSTSYHTAAGLCATVASTVLGNGKGRIADSYFTGEVRDLVGNNNTGGLFGQASRATIERSFNTGSVTAIVTSDEDVYTYAGGLGAYVTQSNISNCYNAGTVIGQKSGQSDFKAVGGLIGYLSVTSISSSSGGHRWGQTSTVSNCYNSGMVLSANDNPSQGIYGRTWDGAEDQIEAITFSNVYNDMQICHEDTTSYGRRTEYLTNSALPAGFSSDIWQSRGGYYPTFKSLQGHYATILSAASITMTSDQWIGKIKNAAHLRAQSPAYWTLLDANGNETESTDNATINAAALTVGDDYSAELLAVVTPEGYMRLFRLGLVPTGMYEGRGTKASPYLLKSADDWNNLSRGVASFGQTHEGDFFKVASDIDFKGSSFRGVGFLGTATPVNTFDGEVDGAGHTLHNLTLQAANVNASGVLQSTGNVWHGGLFTIVGPKGYIHDINIASDASISLYHYGAAFVGQLMGRIENCRNYATINGYGAYVGSMAGVVRDMGSVANCYNAGDIRVIGRSSLGAGGISGYNIGHLSFCQNDGAITTDANGNTAGGITAYSSGWVEDCLNNGNVSSTASAGGIIGSNTSLNGAGYIYRNINNGIVALTADGNTIGGIVGANSGVRAASDNYYDASVNVDGAIASAGHPGMKPLATTELTSGKALQDISADKVEFTAGIYPSLKQFASEERGTLLRSVFIGIDGSQARNNMKKNASLTAPQGITWKIEGETNVHFSIDGSTLKVTIPSGIELGQATLTASKDASAVKTYQLKSLPVYLTGEGTEEAPYLINNVDDFTKLASFVNTTGNDYKGVSFRLTADLDFKGDTITMIAGAPKSRNTAYKFQGNFDGNHKTIKNFVYEYKGTTAVYSGNDMLAIFGTVGESGVIRDLTSEGSISGHRWVAGIAGKLYGKLIGCVNRSSLYGTMSAPIGGVAGEVFQGGSVTDCSNYGTVRGASTYGTAGIAGSTEADTEVSGCVNYGTIVAETGGRNLGGIIGRAGGYVHNCINRGSLESKIAFPTGTPTAGFGGIVGSPYMTLDLRNCSNEADIILTSHVMVGGVVGGSTSNGSATGQLRIDSCFNKGNITALGTVGGVIGFVPSGSQISNSYNEGSVKAVYSSSTYRKLGSSTQGTAMGYAGGFAGYVNSADADYRRTVISKCYNTGAVESGMAYTGGFASYLSTGGTFDGCYNEGNVRAMSLRPELSGDFSAYQVGGIVADLYGNVRHCWNAGDIVTDGHDVGGIVGLQGRSTEITGCVNLGHVTVSESASHLNLIGASATGFQPIAAGIVSRSQGLASAVINLGEITAPDRAGGLASMVFSDGELASSYNAGIVRSTDANAAFTANTANTKYDWNNISDVYYLTGVNPHITPAAGSIDAMQGVRGIDQAGLRAATMGDGFYYPMAGMPMVKGLYNAARAHIAVADIAFAGNDNTSDKVDDYVYITDLPELIWTASDQFSISGAIAVPVKTGKGWLKVASPDGKLERTFELNVTGTKAAIVLPTAIKLDRDLVESGIGSEFILTATLTPDNVTEAESRLTWTSSDTAIATVDPTGKVKCLAPGEAVITATTINNLNAKCNVIVADILPTSVILSEHSHEAIVGDSFTLTATVSPENCTDTRLIWNSDDRSVALVDDKGLVTVIGSGSANITATTVNGLSDSCAVNAQVGIGAIYIDGKEVKTIEYWTADGRRLSSPDKGQPVIVKYIFTDGSSKAEKIMP